MTLPEPQAAQFISLRGAFQVHVEGGGPPCVTMEQVFRAVEDHAGRNSR